MLDSNLSNVSRLILPCGNAAGDAETILIHKPRNGQCRIEDSMQVSRRVDKRDESLPHFWCCLAAKLIHGNLSAKDSETAMNLKMRKGHCQIEDSVQAEGESTNKMRAALIFYQNETWSHVVCCLADKRIKQSNPNADRQQTTR